MSRIKKEMGETLLGFMKAGIQPPLTTKELKALGIEIPVPRITVAEIKRLRKKLNASQDVFARILGTSKSTIVQWESGAKSPGGSAAVLLKTIQNDPNAIRYRIASARRATPQRVMEKTEKRYTSSNKGTKR